MNDSSHLTVLATQATQALTHQAPNELTYDEAKLYAFTLSEEWRPLTVADVNAMNWDVVHQHNSPYYNLWIEDDAVQIALSVSSPKIKRFLRLVRK